jgi:hypothetical protein
MTAHSADSGPPGDSDSLTRLFSVLADARRRNALDHLQSNPSLSLATLADAVAVRESNAPRSDLDDQVVSDVYLTLYHVHVPMLGAAKIVEYEQERDWITRLDTAACDRAFTLLDAIPTSVDDSSH